MNRLGLMTCENRAKNFTMKREGETAEEKAERRAAKKLRKAARKTEDATPPPDKVKSALNDVDLTKWFADNKIKIEDGDAEWKPCLRFKDAGLSAKVLDITKKFDTPSAIQSCAWPIVTSKRDFIGIAETGSGKSLAFGIPALHHLESMDLSKRGRSAKVLVMSPTRELAVQIHEQLVEAAAKMPVASVCIYGGVSKYE